jgi:hypothetical protein
MQPHSDKGDEFELNATWSHEQVDHYLQNIVFPVAFGYADEKAKGKRKETTMTQQWILINKEKQQYEVVDISEPMGADLAQYQGQHKCPTKDANVIIGKEMSFDYASSTYHSPGKHYTCAC